MTDFNKALIAKLEGAIPDLKDKIVSTEIATDSSLPYVVYTAPQKVPVHTNHGIAGYNVLFEVMVYHSKSSEIENIKHRIIKAIDGEYITDKRCYFKSGASTLSADNARHKYAMTFKFM